MYNLRDGILSSESGEKWSSNVYALAWFLWKTKLYINVEKHEGGLEKGQNFPFKM